MLLIQAGSFIRGGLLSGAPVDQILAQEMLNRGNYFLRGHLMAWRHLFVVIVGGEGMLLHGIRLLGIIVFAEHPETHRNTMYKE